MVPASRTHFSPANEAGAPPVPPGPIGKAYCFFAHDVWKPEIVRLRGVRGVFFRACRIGYLATRRLRKDRSFFRASALTYITVLSLVPLLAFSFSMAKGFGLYQRLVDHALNPMLDRTFGPLSQGGEAAPGPGSHEVRQAAGRVLEFVEQTDVASLGALGLLVLLYAVIKLLGTVESSFNEIWGVQKPRTPLRKLTDYLAMVVITPIFLLTATGLTTAAHTSGVIDFLRNELHLNLLINLGFALTPVLALWLGFTFLYMAMPNTRTKLSSALIGALVGGTLWQITLVLHLTFQIGIARYNAIYAGFAAIPIFLIWVNISWVTVLLGAEVCFAHQSEPDYLKLGQARVSDHKLKERLGLAAFARIAATFRKGGEPWTAERLVDDLGVPLRPIDEVLNRLVDQHLLVEVDQGGRAGFLPARDLDTITVKSVLDALKGSTALPVVPETKPYDQEIERLLEGLDAELAESHYNRTIRSLIDETPEFGAASPKQKQRPLRK